MIFFSEQKIRRACFKVRGLDMMQIATHPLLTSAPTVHPLINAAHQALAKLRAGSSEYAASKKAA
jgi:hypothetical protein